MALTHAEAEQQIRGGTHSSGYMFYRRNDGSIGTGPIGRDGLEMLRRMRQGWEPLQAYGTYDHVVYYAEHPYEPLLQRGGAIEFTPRHLIEMGYHLRPPLVPTCGLTAGTNPGRASHKHSTHCWTNAQPAVFPQLDASTDREEYACRFECEVGSYFPNKKARDQHVRVMHKDEQQEILRGKGMAEQLAEAMRAMGLGAAAYPCGMPDCAERYATAQELATHILLHAEPTVERQVEPAPLDVAPSDVDIKDNAMDDLVDAVASDAAARRTRR